MAGAAHTVKLFFGLLLLLLFQWLGSALCNWAELPVPDALAGMVLLLLALMVGGEKLFALLEPIATVLIRHLSLLFIPATIAGFYLDEQIYQQGLHILLVLLVSTALSLWLLSLLARLLGHGRYD